MNTAPDPTTSTPDGGPAVPPNPVQPGSGIPTNDPATNPSAPVNAPAPESLPPQTEDHLAEVVREMGDSSPENFLAQFLEGEGLLPQETPPVAQPPAGVPPVQPGPGNGQPPQAGAPAQVAPPNGQQPGVDPLLARMLGQAPAAPSPQPQVPPVVGHQPAPPPAPLSAPQPSPQAPASAPATWKPFDQPFDIPADVASALDHDDPRARVAAVGATVAAAGNATAQAVVKHIEEVIVPRILSQTVQQVQTQTFEQRLMGDIFEGRAQLQYVNPQLIRNAIQVVTEEVQRTGGSYTKEVGARIGQLALQAAQQLYGGGQGFAPPPPTPAAPQQPQAQYASPPQQGQDGNWYAKLTTGQWVQVPAPQGFAPPQPPPAAAAPWMSGQAAAPFGMPQAPAVTPESEFASFMQGNW